MIAAYRDGAHDVRAQGSVEQHEQGGPDGGAAQQAQQGRGLAVAPASDGAAWFKCALRLKSALLWEEAVAGPSSDSCSAAHLQPRRNPAVDCDWPQHEVLPHGLPDDLWHAGRH